jgi:hypothetical protein
MRTILLALFLAPALSAPAQPPTQTTAPTPPTASAGWQSVQAIRAGTSINVKAKTSHAGCKLKSVDADSLTCTHGKDLVFQRTDIVNIKVPHRVRSTLVGLGIGAGTGAAVGSALGGCPAGKDCFVSRPEGAAIIGVPAALIGALTGVLTDFTRSTVYKAP